MIDGIEPFYQRIADGINAALPDEWRLAWMDAIFYDGSVRSTALLRRQRRLMHGFRDIERCDKAFPEMWGLWVKPKDALVPSSLLSFSTGKFRLQLATTTVRKRFCSVRRRFGNGVSQPTFNRQAAAITGGI